MTHCSADTAERDRQAAKKRLQDHEQEVSGKQPLQPDTACLRNLLS